VCYAWEFGLVANVMLFILVFILQVGFVGVLLKLQVPFVRGSWSVSKKFA
jgi:hypothetical protein